jgi:hypothetical protein
MFEVTNKDVLDTVQRDVLVMPGLDIHIGVSIINDRGIGRGCTLRHRGHRSRLRRKITAWKG